MNDRTLLVKIGYNTFIQIGGKIISVALGFLTVALLTRYLGVEGYGNFTLVFAYMSFFGVFADFGLQLTIIRELAQKSIDTDKIYGTYFWLKFLLVFASTILALIVLLFFPYSQTLKIGIIIGALAVGIGGLSGYGTAIFQSNIRLDLVTLIDVITKFVTVGLIAAFVFLKLSFYHIVATVLFGNIVGFLVTIIILKKFIRFNFYYDHLLAKKIIRWSIPIGFTSLFSLAYFKLDTIMLSVMRGSAEVGIYSLAYKILENILVLWGFYMASVYPMLAKMSNERKSFNYLFSNSFYIAFFSSVFIALVFFFLAPVFIGILGGKNFYSSTLSLRILIFALPILFINNLFYYRFIISSNIKLLLFYLVLSLVINFVLNLVFIPRYGYIAASVITVVTEMIFFLLMAYSIFFFKRKGNWEH